MRCSEFVTAAAMRVMTGQHKGQAATGPVHIIASQNKSSAWSECGQVLDSRRHTLITDVPWVECACRSCRESFLVAKKRRKAGWWGR